MVRLQDTFEDLSPNLRGEEDNFNPLKFTEKIKDVKNTKRADMISKMMFMITRKHRMITPNQTTNLCACNDIHGWIISKGASF